MPLGTERDISTVNQGDTADLYAYVFDQDSNPIPQPILRRWLHYPGPHGHQDLDCRSDRS
jgi:hypothetical protein